MATNEEALAQAQDPQQAYEQAWAGEPGDSTGLDGSSDTPLQDAVAQVVLPQETPAAEAEESTAMNDDQQGEFETEWDKTETDKPAVDTEAAAVIAAKHNADAQSADEYAKAHNELKGGQ